MYRTDDPVKDFLQYDAERERELAKLPRCCECDEPITDEYCYEINGEYLCEDCLNSQHRRAVEDIAE